jgi:hypothetical protein
MIKNRRCCGCELPTTDFITIAGHRLPYHAECHAAARRELRAVRDRIAEALLARAALRTPCDGALPRADEI